MMFPIRPGELYPRCAGELYLLAAQMNCLGGLMQQWIAVMDRDLSL